MIERRWLAFLRRLTLGLMVAGAGTPALAQTVATDGTIATLGRLTGAAKACGLNPERIRKATQRVQAAIDASRTSPPERAAAIAQFNAAQTEGENEARAERSQCTSVHVSFSRLELRLGPAESVAAKRGVPAISELRR